MKVKVWNDNVHEFSQKYRGELLTIPAKKFVEMEREDAIMFMGLANSIKRTADGAPDPAGLKRLRREDPVEKKVV